MSGSTGPPSTTIIFYFLHPRNGYGRNGQQYHQFFSHLHDRTKSDGFHLPCSRLSQLKVDPFCSLLSVFYELMFLTDEIAIILSIGIGSFVIVAFYLRTF